jgi:ketosteroid isomerase-like protein
VTDRYTAPHALTDDQLRERTAAIVRRYIDAINERDFDARSRLLDPNVVFEAPFAPPGFRQRIAGAENYLAFAGQAMEVVGSENLHDILIETLASDTGEAVVFFKSNMTIQKTGAPYRNDYICRFTVRNGLITRFVQYYDPIRLVVALGGSVTPASLEASAAGSQED